MKGMHAMTIQQGFTAACRDCVTNGYPLGHGYRLYMPGLMRFAAQDDFSPFGVGGANPYVYGASNPINGVDPSGHDFLWGVFLTLNTIREFLPGGMGGIDQEMMTSMGLPQLPTWNDQQPSLPTARDQLVARIVLDIDFTVIGIAVAFATLGVGLAVVASAFAMVSGGLAIASDVEDYKGNETASKDLSYASLGVGVIDGLVTGGAEAALSIAKMGSYSVEAGARLSRPVLRTVVRAAAGQLVVQGASAALYFGLPPLIQALIGRGPGAQPAFEERLLPAGSTQAGSYRTAFGYPQPADVAIIEARPEQRPAWPTPVAAQPSMRPGYAQ
ncbi:hypothetical protein C0Z17_24450 [Trinickia caryophylli]|nr:hypothetical protein C0Z17_24450 [Trinickia caryophylli]